MKIAVLVKQVPGRDAALRPTTDGRWFDESEVAFESNESDTYALEEALQIKERAGGEGEVIAVSLGPERVQKCLRDCLARGADRAIHLTAEAAEATDPYTTAATFAALLKEEGCDLIFSGVQSDDLSMGQTGVLLGELLGMATASLVTATELTDGAIRVRRELEGGWSQWLTLPLPASLAIQTGINQPRYPTIKGIMGAKRKPIDAVATADLADGAPLQRLERLFVQQKEKRTVMIEGTPEEAAARLADVLKNEIKVV